MWICYITVCLFVCFVSVYGNPVKRKRSFLESLAKLDDNVMYLCFSQVKNF